MFVIFILHPLSSYCTVSHFHCAESTFSGNLLQREKSFLTCYYWWQYKTFKCRKYMAYFFPYQKMNTCSCIRTTEKGRQWNLLSKFWVLFPSTFLILCWFPSLQGFQSSQALNWHFAGIKIISIPFLGRRLLDRERSSINLITNYSVTLLIGILVFLYFCNFALLIFLVVSLTLLEHHLLLGASTSILLLHQG